MSQLSPCTITRFEEELDVYDDLKDLNPEMITKKIKVKIVRRFVCPALRDRLVEFILADSKFREVKQGRLDPNYCVDLIGRLVRTIDFRASDSLGVNHRFVPNGRQKEQSMLQQLKGVRNSYSIIFVPRLRSCGYSLAGNNKCEFI
ncbi:unnamed protein product [Arabidopsis lyrata]|uniref:Predicted protein n=1 Tax=Arabidopsis lyrata subsp. lyrata TaxID=81972 RepID=D7MHD7_ARALL|nr:predicted protein [Arabidopsis lyrata subsp. lyrata]CAH8276819.1 unnamed protein product [Arabidopsis lyrata]